MSKERTYDPRKIKQCKWLIEYFKKMGRPVSFTEVLNHTKTWRYDLTSNQLANMLAKSRYFKEVGGEQVNGRIMGGPYRVNVYELSDEVENVEPVKKRICSDCTDELLRTEKGRCKACYLAWRRKERAKRGEA